MLTKKLKKNYILDTNILIQSPNAIFGFADNNVIVTATTLQELDGLKNAPGETGYRAREAIRTISSLSSRGNLLEGIEINGFAGTPGTFRIEPNGTTESHLPKGFSLDKADNRIINSTISLKNESKNHDTILITNDISMRVNAEVCGLTVQGYRNEQIEHENVYTGRQTITVSGKTMKAMYGIDNSKDKRFILNDVLSAKELTLCTPMLNEYVTFVDDALSGKIIGRCVWIEGEKYFFELIDKNQSPMSIKARNDGQRMALNALLAPVSEIPLVILKGKAGTAKTFLSLAAGLDQTYDKKYDKVMITRTNTLSDADIGFLPGSLEEKMGPLVAPFMDNLESLIKGNDSNIEPEDVRAQMEDIFESKILEIVSIAYMRGRSITNSYLIVDEAQNTSIGQILEIITRAGEGTKIVICGDPDQIDNPKLDKLNNGLSYASEKMKGSNLCAQISFSAEETVRSPLATEAAERLTPR